MKFITPLLAIITLSGCMTVREHEHLMAAQALRYTDLQSELTQLKQQHQQQNLDYQRDAALLGSCRSDQSRCATERSAFEQQLTVCNRMSVKAPAMSACKVSDIHLNAPLSSQPSPWLLSFQLPAQKVLPQKVSTEQGVVYQLSEEQADNLNKTTADLLLNVQGWQMWYRDAVQRPAEVAGN
ncbi:hypothetical protein ACQUQU_03490 [Thalassolituus sp. LLYu03]|uniref:hypothetical protein n=1 Tax=Thalassolituus sp. LLYu03 TaxID=3421656 RepID=UPI003D276058